VADVGERPARLDPDVDVHAPPARGLREADVAKVLQQRPGLAGHAHGVGEVRPRLRVEVQAQLVGVVDVAAANRPRVERQRPHLRRPGDDGDLRGADLIRVAARREHDPRRLDVVGSSARDPLLEEGVATALLARREHDARVHPLGPALEGGGPPVQRPHDAPLDGEVVHDDVELAHRRRPLGRREDHPIGVRHAHLAPPGLDGRGVARGHCGSLTRTASGRSAGWPIGRRPVGQLAVDRLAN
jgi:hypothetical protein